jgi:CBS domain-containing protein
MRAADIMTTKVVTASPENSIRHAAQIMLDHRISGLVVIDDAERLVGMITEGDLLRRTELGLRRISAPVPAQEYLQSSSWKVADLMSPKVVSVDENVSVDHVAAIMEEDRIKRLPVTRNGRLVGIVSRADLLRVVATAQLEPPLKGDEALRRGVLARFGDVKELDGLRLGVIVSKGVVHLWGDVDSEQVRRAACVVAENVPGVAAVVDHLGVIEPTDARGASDTG